PQVTGADRASKFPSKGFQLCALLARAPGHRMSRREVASLLWSSAHDQDALTNLRQLLVRIHRALTPDSHIVAADGPTLALPPLLLRSLDLCAFDLHAASTTLAEMLEGIRLCRGNLLEGVGEITEEFSDWLTRERAALRERFFALATAAL